MATYLHKPMRRAVLIGAEGQIGEEWIVSLLPPDDVYRFPRIEFRKKKSRKVRYWLPVEAARNDAARRWNAIQDRERAKLRKERRRLRKEGLL